MANTVLNADTPGMATNNPQANVNQVQPNTANQSQVNPITIPIQIQPQVAGQPQIQTQTNQNLQMNRQQNYNAPSPQPYTNNNQSNKIVDFNQIYSAYQGAYGNTYNTNNQISNSGIKKTSLGTTIVTPTVANLNSVQGQYQSAYSDTINGIISQMLTNMNTGFQYDPTTDNSLRVASEYAANSTLQSLAGSGVLNSSSTAERVARIVADLIPQYEEKAHNRWTEYLGQLADTAQLVMSYDNQQFAYWADAKDREFQEKEFEFNKQQKELENAWRRVDELGYVDNKASAVLGVKVGTLSYKAREAKEQREFELAKMREQFELERENDIAIAKLKSELELNNQRTMARYNADIEKEVYNYKSKIDTKEKMKLSDYQLKNDKSLYGYKSAVDTQKSKELSDYQLNNDKSLYRYRTNIDTQKSKELADYQANIDRNTYSYKSNIDTQKSKELASYQNSLSQSSKEYEYQLAQKYGTSSTKNSDYTNYSTHDEIIKNRWGIEDPITGQISVRDGTKNNNDAVYNYLANAYASGMISQKDFAALVAKYGITVPSQKSSTTSGTTNSNNGSNPFGYGNGGGFR